MDEQLDLLKKIYGEIKSLNFFIATGFGFTARQEIEQLKLSLKDQPLRLEHFGYKVYSQNDEDGILAEIFKRLGITRGNFCEIGVENGLECNSLHLIHQGWRGVWLEGNQRQETEILNKFNSIIDAKQLEVGIHFVTPDNINSLLETHLKKLQIDPADLDFLSIDIDGMDIHLLNALQYKPKVICIEYNSKFPPPLKRRPVYDPNYEWKVTDYMGSSLSSLHEAGEQKGYTLVSTQFCGTNAFFVRSDLVQDKFTGPFTAEALYHPARYYLYHLNYRFLGGHQPDFGPYMDEE